MLLARPHEPGIETVNDKDGFVCNAWRSIAFAPDETAEWADWPSMENDLHARHTWLKARREVLVSQLEADPEYYDPQIAGWWLWGMAQWIGGGFCGESGAGPWVVEGGRLVRGEGDGVKRQRLHLGNAGQGVSRQMLHLSAGQGVARQMLHLGERRCVGRLDGGGLRSWFAALSQRLRRVRVCCGDWSRICGPSPTEKLGLTGVFLDPPYSAEEDRDMNLYAEESGTVAHDVRAWCVERGGSPLLRIALCGYGEVHDELLRHGWSKSEWKASGGYAKMGNARGMENRRRERIWWSPACLDETQGRLF